MFERFRSHHDDDAHAERGNGVAVKERERTTARPVRRQRVAERATADAEVRRRDEYGGMNWGAAFFGWLVAVGLGALLVGIAAAAGAAVGLVEVSNSELQGNAETIGIVGGALLVGILALAYFAGGYVAGRMSRFDGARQGVGVWVIGLIVTGALAIAAAIGGAEYNVLERLDLPRIPIDEGDLTTGGAIALAAALVGTFLASALGGKLGQRYHRRVDAAGWNGHERR